MENKINIPQFSYRKKSDGTPILSKKDMEENALLFLKNYSKAVGKNLLEEPQPTPIEDIIKYCNIEIDYKKFSTPEILGMTTFSDGTIEIIDIVDGTIKDMDVKQNTIIISAELADAENQEARFRYTAGHELSHCMYHRDLFCPKEENNLLFDFEDTESKSKELKAVVCHRDKIENLYEPSNVIEQPFDWIEWQAEYSSSCLLMPHPTFDIAVQNSIKEQKRTKEIFKIPDFLFTSVTTANSNTASTFIDDDPSISIDMLVWNLTRIFNVSDKAARIRLNKLGYTKKAGVSYLW